MLKREDYLMIQHKHDDGVYIKDIAEELGGTPQDGESGVEEGRCADRETAAGPGEYSGPVQAGA